MTVTSAGRAVRDGAWPPREKGLCLQANSNALLPKFLFRLRLLGKEHRGRGVVRSEAQTAARLGASLAGRPPRAVLAGGSGLLRCPPEGFFAGGRQPPHRNPSVWALVSTTFCLGPVSSYVSLGKDQILKLISGRRFKTKQDKKKHSALISCCGARKKICVGARAHFLRPGRAVAGPRAWSIGGCGRLWRHDIIPGRQIHAEGGKNPTRRELFLLQKHPFGLQFIGLVGLGSTDPSMVGAVSKM